MKSKVLNDWFWGQNTFFKIHKPNYSLRSNLLKHVALRPSQKYITQPIINIFRSQLIYNVANKQC